MTETRKVTGLLGVVAAEAEGAEWEVSTALQNGVVPGMGLGASPDAIRWAQQGWLAEEKARRTQKPKRAANRPPKDRYMDIDCIRAFSAWRMAQQLRKLLPECDIGGGIRISNRELIRLMQGVEAKIPVAPKERLFPMASTSLETSVSRGRGKLEVDKLWRSAVCEKLL